MIRFFRRFGHKVREPLPADASVQRLSSLQFIGVGSIAAGLSLAGTGPPLAGLQLFESLPGWPWMYGLGLALSGLGIFIGSWRRVPRMQFFSALVTTIWYMLFAAGLILQWVLWHLGEEIGQKPLVHQAWVYLTVGSILIGHVMTIGKTRRIEDLDP